jgi:hypothetical protein
MDPMQWPEPRSFNVDLQTGLMTGTDSRYQKCLRDLSGLYADAAAFDALATTRGNEVVYEVTDYRPNSNPGDLITGVTRMNAGKVGDEFFMTRGHIHAAIDRPELYFGLKGYGVANGGYACCRDQGEHRLLRAAAMDSSLGEFGAGRFRDALLLSRRFGSGLLDHRGVERHETAHCR